MTNLKFKLQNSKLFTNLKNDSHFAELIKGSGIAFILRIVGLGFGYIFTLLVTRTLGAKALGIFALCMVLLQISSVIGRLGMDTALLKFTAEFVAKKDFLGLKNIYKKMMTLVVPFSIILSILVFSLSPVISNEVFHKPYLINYFKIVSCCIFPFVLLWIHTEGIRGFKKIKEYMLLQQSGIFILTTIFFGITILFSNIFYNKLTTNYYKFTINNYFSYNFIPLFCYITAIIILSIIAFILYKKYLSYNSKSKIQNSKSKIYNLKEILSVSFPLLFSSSLFLIMSWTDTIMLGMFRSTEEVGIYNVVIKVSMLTSFTLNAINTIAAPKFAEFWGKRDMKGLEKVAQQSTKLIFWTSAPILIVFFLFPSSILNIFGSSFKTGATALIILSIGQFINSISGSVGYILQMTGKQKVFQNIILTATFINIALNLILIPRFGINGAAFASVVSMIFWNIVSVIYILKHYMIVVFYKPRLFLGVG